MGPLQPKTVIIIKTPGRKCGKNLKTSWWSEVATVDKQLSGTLVTFTLHKIVLNHFTLDIIFKLG